MEKRKARVPLRLIKNPKGLLYFKNGDLELKFGDIYDYFYIPISRSLPRPIRLRKMPFYDVHPLVIFLEYRAGVNELNENQRNTILGLNLHYIPPQFRSIIVSIIDLIKVKMRLLGKQTFDTMEDLFPETVGMDPVKLAENSIDPKTDAKLTEVLAGKKGIQWGEISRINNPFLNLIPVMFRVYKIRRMRKIQNLKDMDMKERQDVFEKVPYIFGPWKSGNIREVAKLARANKDWNAYIRSQFQEK